MQNNKDEMDELFDRISQLLEEKRLEAEQKQFGRKLEALLKEMGVEQRVGQAVLWVFFKEPIEELQGIPLFIVSTVSDNRLHGCAFCGYNETPKVLRLYPWIPRNWRRKFPDELSSQTIQLCPTCSAELYFQMRQELSAKVTAKELILFLSQYSLKKAWKQ